VLFFSIMLLLQQPVESYRFVGSANISYTSGE
jgi:hypothetical protein